MHHRLMVWWWDSSPSSGLVETESALEEMLGLLAIVVTGLVGYFFTVRQKLIDDRRKSCAQAIADALAWREFPYRVRRRQDDELSTRTALVERMHSLQEALYYHENWLRIEMPHAQPHYARLVDKVKRTTEHQLKEAWGATPAPREGTMNIGDLGIESVDGDVHVFAEAARSHLTWWKFWQ